MAPWSIADYKPPPPESIWRCPCGFTGTFYSVKGHRKGHKKRPECKGNIEFLSAGTPAETPDATPALTEAPETVSTPDSPDVSATLDPEELARQLNQSRPPINLEGAVLDLQHSLDELSQPDGEWIIETPDGPQVISQAKETVALPVLVRVIYDWAKQQGWHQGDGSLSAFVTDIILDHFTNCWGKRIVVVDEAQLVDEGDESEDLVAVEGE